MTHYYDKDQRSPSREEEITIHVFNQQFSFFSASGLFSKAHLDNATKLLIEQCDVSDAKTVLDLGCGWGAVAILSAIRHPDKQIVASDVSSRAVAYTKKNAKRHNVDIEVVSSDLFTGLQDRSFDVILTNPPYVAGREICFAFITESFNHLNKGGSLQLVARHNKGGKVLGEKMQEVFGNMEAIAKQSGFRIYKSVKE